MASKKQQTAEALKPKGWQNQFGEEQPPPKETPKSGPLKRKTYLMTDDLIARLDATAKGHGIGVNELVRYLCKHGLDELDTGTHKLPVRAVTTYTLDMLGCTYTHDMSRIILRIDIAPHIMLYFASKGCLFAR